jgi:hypothetical protein
MQDGQALAHAFDTIMIEEARWAIDHTAAPSLNLASFRDRG